MKPCLTKKGPGAATNKIMIALDGNFFSGSETILYTSPERPVCSRKLEKFMVNSGCPFVQKNGLDCLDELDSRFGGTVDLPGIVVEGCLWIPSAAPNLAELLQEYIVDKMLEPPTSKPIMAHMMQHEIDVSGHQLAPASAESPYPSADALLDSTRNRHRQNGPLEITPTRVTPKPRLVLRETSATATALPGQRLVSLPLGSTMTVAELTRVLVAATPHTKVSTRQQHPATVETFRGAQGLQIWKNLFGDPASALDDDLNVWIAFGTALQEHGILYNYTPNCADFTKTYLVLKPFQDARSLNTLLQWSSDCSRQSTTHSARSTIVDDAMNVILRLSRAMDTVCQSQQQQDDGAFVAAAAYDHPAFVKLEEAVCQLQVICMPADPTAKVTFALNLHNLIVRHAIIASSGGKYSAWPKSLPDLHALFGKIGYNVGGQFISVTDLRVCLFGPTGAAGMAQPKLVVAQGPKQRRGFCSCTSSVSAVAAVDSGNDFYYDGPVIATDVRVLTALASGTASSPAVSTIYPDQLEEGLEAAAKQYCQTRVVIERGNTVVLPSLLSQYRHDFGTAPQNIVRSIKSLISPETKKQIRDLHTAGQLKIVFKAADPLEWECCIAASTKQADDPSSPFNPCSSTTTSKTPIVNNIGLAPAVAKQMTTIFPRTDGNIAKQQPTAPTQQTFSRPVSVEIETGCFACKPTPELRRIESGESACSNASGGGMKFITNAIGLIPPICGRQVSMGDGKPIPPSHKTLETMLGLDPSERTASTAEDDDGIYVGEGEDGFTELPNFQAEMSTMTYGSEFDIRFNNNGGDNEDRFGNVQTRATF